MFCNKIEVVHNTVNVLNVIQMLTVKLLLLYYGNCASAGKKKKKQVSTMTSVS